MNYGLQISASGALTAVYRQNALTNNLANINTIGYKPDVVATRQRDPVRIEDNLPFLPSNQMLETLGAGVMMAPNRVSFGQGQLEITNADLDLAIEGDGFFVVRGGESDGAQRLMFTRDGRFSLDNQRRLVLASSGLPVLSQTENPITVGPGKVEISPDGMIRQEGQVIAQLGLVDFHDRDRLEKKGESLFSAPSDAVASRRPADGSIRQGAVEAASMNEISAMMQVTSASRDFGANIGMIRYHDQLMNLAINTLGRIS